MTVLPHRATIARRTLLFAGLAMVSIGIAEGRAEQALNDLPRSAVKAGIADRSLILIDVREPDEFAAGHIPGAINMPLSAFDPAKLPREADKQVVIYCHSGRRARLAVAQAQAAGRSDIDTIYGGSMSDWIAAGEAVEK